MQKFKARYDHEQCILKAPHRKNQGSDGLRWLSGVSVLVSNQIGQSSRVRTHRLIGKQNLGTWDGSPSSWQLFPQSMLMQLLLTYSCVLLWSTLCQWMLFVSRLGLLFPVFLSVCLLLWNVVSSSVRDPFVTMCPYCPIQFLLCIWYSWLLKRWLRVKIILADC